MIQRALKVLANVTFIAAVLWLFAHYWTGQRWSNVPVHSAVEAFCALACFLLGYLFLHRESDDFSRQLFIVALGFMSMGILDGFHAFAEVGQGFVLLRSTAALAGGMGFALAWLPVSIDRVSLRRWLPWGVTGLSLVLGVCVLTLEDTLPARMTNEGVFTPFAIQLNLVALFLFLIGAIWFAVGYIRTGRIEDYLMTCLAGLFCLVQVEFPNSQIWSFSWWEWHFVRLFAALLILIFLSWQHLRLVRNLRSALAERHRAEAELRRHRDQLEQIVAEQTHDLTERVKKTQCLYAVAEQCQSTGSVEELFQSIPALLPAGWLYPEITRARILFDGEIYADGPLETTPWGLRRDIRTGGRTRGAVEVYLLEERVTRDGDYFLPQEALLLEGIARNIGEGIARREFEARTEHLNAVLKAIRNVNQLIEKETDHQRLIQVACECLVETRGYLWAWIVLLDDHEPVILVSAGNITEQFQELLSRFKRKEPPECARRAFQSPGVCTVRSPIDECGDCPLAASYPGRAGMAARLATDGRTIGLLSVSVPAVFADDKEERDLLKEVADDIALALRGIELKTRRDQAEKTIREREARYRTLVESLPQKIFLKDRNSVYISVNENYARDFGLKPEEFIGKDDYAFYPPNLVEKYREDDRAVLASGQSKNIDEIYVVEGQEFWVNTVKTPVRDDKGNIVALFGMFTDITGRKQAEETLRRNASELALRNQIAEVFLSVPDEEMYTRVLEILLDAMQSRYGVFGYIDEWRSLIVPTMTRTIWDKCNVPDKRFVFHRETWGNSSWPTAIREKRTICINETSTCTPTGHVPITRHISLPILHRGEVVGLIQVANKDTDYTGEDVSLLETIGGMIGPVLDARLTSERQEQARQRAENDLYKANENLLRSNQELEQFAYVASHDLQEPLRKISSFTELFVKRFPDLVDEKAQQYVAYILDGAKRMQRLIQDLLSYSRVGRLNVETEETDLAGLAEQIRIDMSNLIAERNAVLVVQDLPTLHVNRSGFYQVFQNLIGNAIKFNRSEKPSVKISARHEEREWIFCVEDNGIGIDPQYRDRIFIIFQRLNTREEYSSTGIGLSICKKIVESRGGRIWVESESNTGSKFYFTIPDEESKYIPGDKRK